MFESADKCGLQFGCTQCSFCCTGSPGYVWLSDADIGRLCSFLGLDFDHFAETYCVYVNSNEGRALSLREKAGYDCIFLAEGRCSIYPARPAQCRTYPFWEEILETAENWVEEAKYCPGIGKGHWVLPESIQEAVQERRINHIRLFFKAGTGEPG
jgi:Fe-S-cluster containining protein